MIATQRGSKRVQLALVAALATLLLLAALGELLPLVPSAPPPPPDYRKDGAWLCRPGRADVCATPVTARILAPDGATSTVTYVPDPAALIDCFYVYPTVSRAPGDNAPIAATAEETGVVRRHLARFSTVCRPFAPLYRQVTRKGLRKVIDTPQFEVAPRLVAYADVRAAWHDYLARDNKSRGFVLIGHSQGSRMLARLMADEIGGTPLQARLVGAIIPGTSVDVPEGARVGGTLAHIPLCASTDTPGCVIAYASFPAARKISPGAHFGTSATPGMVAACVDPAAVAGTPTLDADLPLWGEARDRLGTDFIELPGLINARCAREGRVSYLAIATDANTAAGARAAEEIEQIGEFSPTWGLHSIDLDLAQGTLVDIVRRQTAAYLRGRRPEDKDAATSLPP